MTDYTKRSWNSLSQLREHLDRDGKEKVKEFNGFELITNKNRYGLFQGAITKKPVKKQ